MMMRRCRGFIRTQRRQSKNYQIGEKESDIGLKSAMLFSFLFCEKQGHESDIFRNNFVYRKSEKRYIRVREEARGE